MTKLLQKVEEVRGKQLLTRFQQQKFRHFFYHVLDLNSDHVISQVFVLVVLLILRTMAKQLDLNECTFFR